jgi:hypothetical protein
LPTSPGSVTEFPGGVVTKAGIPERLLEGRRYQNKAVTHTGYDVGADGAAVFTVVQGWFGELNRLVPTN